MTTLKAKLQADRTAHWKAGQALEKDTLGLVLGGIQTAEKSGKSVREFTDEDVLKFLTTEVKKRRDTAKTYFDAGVTDRGDRETAEADFLATYLPAQLTVEEVKVIVQEVVTSSGPTANPGQLIGRVMGLVKGKADGALVRQLVQEATS